MNIKTDTEVYSYAHSYALVGFGRVGRALAAYLESRKIPFRLFGRSSPIDRNQLLEIKTHCKAILLAVSDPSIPALVEQIRTFDSEIPLVHFSGSVQAPGAFGFHPLYSFSERVLGQEEFESIPFNVDPQTESAFRAIFPDFKNPVFEMARPKDALYHALCVSLGNLPQYIQNTSLKQLQENFQLPAESLLPFLKALLKNLEESLSPANSQKNNEIISGPIARKDTHTLKRHLEVLENASPMLHQVYKDIAKQEGLYEITP